MTEFARESAADVIDEIQSLLQLHYQEIAHYQDIPLEPDWPFYRTAKIVQVYTVRDEGKLIGYAVFFVATNKHYMSSRQAVQDILFLLPAYRGTTIGSSFIDFFEDQLRAQGVQVIYQHEKKAHRFGRLLQSKGYEEVDALWAKRLDKEQ